MLNDCEVLMSSFHRKNTESQPALREFNVGEPDDMQPEAPAPYLRTAVHQQGPGYELSAADREELQRLRQDSASKQAKIGDHAKKRIEILANIGRLTKEVEFGGIVFGLRTLKAREAREATMSIFNCTNDIDASFEIRRQTLARAIFQVDGQDLEAALGGNDFALKLSLIDNMEDVTIIKLYNEFNDLRTEVQNKYGLQTEKEVKEVVEDIKK